MKEINKTNLAILRALRADGRMSWQAVGRQVHLTGQAVAARVQDMLDEGVISAFSIKQDALPRFFITVFMEHARFSEFEHFLQNHLHVEEAFKVAGEGCYLLVYQPVGASELDAFVSQLLPFGRYKVLTSLKRVK